MFLAGTGAFLSRQRWAIGKHQLSRYLLQRGFLLVVLELTVIRFGWTFNWDVCYGIAQVIWALGWSMVMLAGLIHLPQRWLALLSIVVIAGHNLADGIAPQRFGSLGWLWIVLHVPDVIEYRPGYSIDMFYPLIPWFAVMAAGYCAGPLFLQNAQGRRKVFLLIGTAALLAFIALRLTNAYGDPKPWSPQRTLELTVFSFLNCQKYPPSLLYLLITLGIMFICLALFEWQKLQRLGFVLLSFGRVPLFFYIAHIYLIHGLAVLLTLCRGLPADWLFTGTADRPFPEVPSPEFGVSLPAVYGIWLLVLLMLYPLCAVYSRLNLRKIGTKT